MASLRSKKSYMANKAQQRIHWMRRKQPYDKAGSPRAGYQYNMRVQQEYKVKAVSVLLACHCGLAVNRALT